MSMEPLFAVDDTGGRELPPGLWPAGIPESGGPLFFAPISKKQANALIVEWAAHPLGPFRRPFAYQAWGLAVRGRAVAVAISASTVGASAAGYGRFACVELARIDRAPGDPTVLRAMLRLWRDYLAAEWAAKYWPADAAVSYALPGKIGNLYRFDGWRKHGAVKASGGGGTWSGRPRSNELAEQAGVRKDKTLWFYDYAGAAGGPCDRG